MKASTVTVKGQVTIPQEIRHRLGVKPGDRVRFRELDAGVVIERQDSRIEAAFGAFKARREISLPQVAKRIRKGWTRRAGS